MRCRPAFTIIELLIVIGLMSLLSAIVIPQMKNFNVRQDLASITKGIISEIRLAQTMATSGVQGQSEEVGAYRITFVRESQDANDTFRGYQMNAVNTSSQPITPSLSSQGISCPVCIISSESEIQFQVPTGRLSEPASSSYTFSVCSPNIGRYEVMVDINGRIQQGDFLESGCVCSRGC